MIRIAGILIVGLLAIASTAAAVGLIMVGNHAHWTSDGPGMLLIMIAIGVFGFAALGLWKLFLAILYGTPAGPPAPLPEFPPLTFKDR